MVVLRSVTVYGKSNNISLCYTQQREKTGVRSGAWQYHRHRSNKTRQKHPKYLTNAEYIDRRKRIVLMTDPCGTTHGRFLRPDRSSLLNHGVVC